MTLCTCARDSMVSVHRSPVGHCARLKPSARKTKRGVNKETDSCRPYWPGLEACGVEGGGGDSGHANLTAPPLHLCHRGILVWRPCGKRN